MSLVLCILTLKFVGVFSWKNFHKVCLVLLCWVFSLPSVQLHSFTKKWFKIDLLSINSEMQCPCSEIRPLFQLVTWSSALCKLSKVKRHDAQCSRGSRRGIPSFTEKHDTQLVQILFSDARYFLTLLSLAVICFSNLAWKTKLNLL